MNLSVFILFFISWNVALSLGESDGFFICEDSGRPIPTDYICDGYEDCIDGADEFDCGSAFKCESYEFQCASVDKCVNMVFRCDGHNHCQDGSDEKGCGLRACKEWEFTCGNGNCIPELYQCDQYDDCGDNSDEDQCVPETCNPETEWACESDSKCISKNWRCDYEKDCYDGSDEQGCTVFNHRCGAGLFNCSQTECISSNKLCDGVPDCKTNAGADEDHSICVVLECGFGKFACPEKCLDSVDLVCDGNYDCMDGSDEMACATSTCTTHQFQCIEGTMCIELDKRCDGMENCMDGSDEFLCSSTVYLNCSSSGEFRCDDGLECIPETSLCDGSEQCGDASDEAYCANMTAGDGTNSCLVNNGGCEHKCNYISGLNYCSCDYGYAINTRDRKSCIDINECDLQYGVCDQVCTNTIGGYTCSCAEGYMESMNNGKCKATGPAVNLLFSNWYDVQQLNIRTGQLNYTLNGLISATAIDYHYKHGLVFWSDIHLQVIMKAKFDGTGEKVVADLGIERPEGIAIDWLNDRIYWTDSELNRVEVANIDGSGRAVLFSSLNHPRDIVIDPINRFMFWTEESKIIRASLDGSYKKVLLSGISNYISWPTGLAIDLPSQTLYWVDAGTRSIGSCTLDGRHPRLLYSGNITHPFGITVFDDTLYWTDRNLGGIYSVNRNTGKSFRKILIEVFKPMDIVGVHPLKQPLNQSDLIDLCSVDNGGCDYLCLSGTNNFTCHCPAFRTLLSDKRSCSKMDLFILFSMSDRINVFSFKSTGRYDVKLPLYDLDMSNIVVMDWDSQHDLIFWGDSSTKTINSASINGSSQRVIVDMDVSSPSGMAVDWTNDKLYWTDADLGRIYVSELNGSCVSTVLTVDEGTLTSIVLHPAKGLLFYGVNINDKKSFIRSAHLDGTNNRKVGSYDNSIPMLMTIDYQSDRLYWIDNINIRLLSIFVNGSDFEELLESGTLYESKGLTNYASYLYWTDEIDGSIYQVEKEPPYETRRLISNRQDLRDISVFHRDREIPESHPCWSDNGGCSHLCFGIPSENDEGDEDSVRLTVSCGCPTGYILGDDTRTCASEIDTFLIFGSVSRIGKVSLEVDWNVDVTTPIHPKPNGILSVDYDLRNDYVYWIEKDSAYIYRAPINGGKKEIVISHGLVRPTALAVDWLGGNLYFGDSGSRRLEVCRLDGTSRKVLMSDNNVGEVLSIVVDLYSEYIFWSSSEPSPQVFRSAMDGSNTMAIIHSSEVSLPVALAVDNRGASSKLFVADSVRQRIKMFDTNGKGQVLYTITDSPITGLAVDKDSVYWIDGDTGILHRSRKDDDSISERLNTNLLGVSDLRLIRKAYLLENRALSRNYACKEGLCSHLCLPNWDINRYSCACPTGIQDQVNCPTAPSLYLLFTTSNSIRRLSLESNEFHDVSLVPNLHKVSYVDYHLTSAMEGRIYWSDPDNQAIMMANIDGTKKRSFLQLNSNLRGLSVDWTTGSVYYVNAGVPSIEVTDSTGTFVKVLLNSSVVHDPVDIAVFPFEGFIFWTEWNGNPSRLMRAKMDGSEPLTVVTLSNQKPTDLTLSPDTGYLHWVDANSGSIQRVKYDGTRHEVIWESIGQPFGVAAYENSIFWSDVIDGMIYRCDAHNQLTQKRMQYVERHSGTPKGMVIVTKNRKGEIDGNYSGSACGYRNGGCAYLCASISQEERKCLCPSLLPNCIEYAGIHSWTIPSSSSTTYSAGPTISRTSTIVIVATSSYTQSSTPTGHLNTEKIGEILDNVSLTILILIGVFLVAIVVVLCLILVLFSKYKSLPAHNSSKSQFKSNTMKPTPMFTNPLYEKTTLPTGNEGEGKKFGKTTDLKVEPRYQLNNTVELQTRTKTKTKTLTDEFNAGKVRLRSLYPPPEPVLKPKLKVMNTKTLNTPPLADEEEQPEEYKITPVQPRRLHSSSKSCSSPPPSPLTVDVPITVHYSESSPSHKPAFPQQQPQPPPKPAIVTTSSPTKNTRHVQFATSVTEAPPVPPRSGRLSSCTLNQATKPADQPPPPLSAPATSPPPTFSFSDVPVTVLPASSTDHKVSAQNPIFGRCSSSSESDIIGIMKDHTAVVDGGSLSKETSIAFASDSNVVLH